MIVMSQCCNHVSMAHTSSKGTTLLSTSSLIIIGGFKIFKKYISREHLLVIRLPLIYVNNGYGYE